LLDCSYYLEKSQYVNLFEIIVTNDGSTDNSSEILLKIEKKFKNIRIHTLLQNYGAGYALNQSIKLAKYDWTIIIDSDGQFPAENLELLTSYVFNNKKNKCIMGIREKKDRVINVIGSRISGMICNFIYNSKLKDFNSALKIIDTKLLKSIKLEAKKMNYSTDVTAKLLEKNILIKELKIKHNKRLKGNSSSKFFITSFSRLIFILYLAIRKVLIKFKILFV